MKKEKIHELEQLFFTLISTPFEHDVNAFIEVNLEIIWALTEDKTLQKQLRSYFSHLGKIAPDIHQTLRREFHAIDMSLEEELRGFSHLLEFVLEDGDLGFDVTALLKGLPEKYAALAPHFQDFLNQKDALRDLERAYDFLQPKAMIVLFVHHLVSVLTSIGYEHKETQSMVEVWLLKRAALAPWVRLFHENVTLANVASVIRYCKNQHEGWQELCHAFLCFASANNLLISEEYINQLDGIIASIGLDGAGALLESGFLQVEGFSKQEKAATIYHLA